MGVFLDGTPLSWIGVGFGVASSALTATHSVVIKQSLNIVGGSALALSWYTNLLSAALLAPLLILAGEGMGVIKLFFGVHELVVPQGSMTPLATFLWGSLITVRYLSIIICTILILCFVLWYQGVLGFMMSIASLMSIKVTSPITHMVSSAVRGVAASLLGMWLFHDIITRFLPSSLLLCFT